MGKDNTATMKKAGKASAGGVIADQLIQYTQRIERLEEEKADIAAAIREVYAEAKSGGYEPKVMRQLIKLRKMDPHEVDEQESLLDLYKNALGMS